MTKLSPSAQAIVDAGRTAQSPSAATKASVLDGLDRALMEPAASSTSGLAQASGKAGIGKVLIGSLLVVALGVGYLFLRSDGDAVPTTPHEQPAETALVDVREAPPTPIASPAIDPSDDQIAGNEQVVPSQVDPPKSKAARKPRVSAADSLLAEQTLIGAAQRATRDGDYATAKSLLAQHRREFERGVLAPERKAVSAITSCLAGELDKGQREAGVFLESHPRSPLANQVRKSCQLP